MPGPLRLSHRDILPPGQQVHLARAALSSRRPARLHEQDFPELIWVQNGTVRHHLPDTREELAEGDLRFLRPGDAHALQGRGEAPILVSLSFHPELIAGLGARHPALLGHFFWSRAALPEGARRDGRQMAAINQAALRLERSSRTALEAEAFLLPLLASLMDEAPSAATDMPDWLSRACAAARDPAVFRDGAAGLARVAGRAHPHVSRMMRRYLDQTPSDYVNARRMEFAARRLGGTGDPLAEIAADCGIPNLSHFHKLFRAHHGMTPLAYRKAHQHEVLQPR
ncbi:MAG: helix-turn-helix domain-containing protein [Rubellimicrobium sp.]|nr:helix-turn-helix domain-containing protein [Rubellimicrobium sp.]